MQAQDERRIQWTQQVPTSARLDVAVTGAAPVTEPVIYLKECASCGGQFPSFRAICDECEDVADVDGFRDGRKVVAEPVPATSA